MALNSIGLLQKALYDWATTTLKLTVIWEDQAQVRPPKPYVSLKLINPGISVGFDEQRIDDGRMIVCGDRELVLSLNVFGVNAIEYVSYVQGSLWFPSVQEFLRRRGLVVVDRSEVRNLSQLFETAFESRAQIDVRFRSAMNVEDTGTGFIETVDVSGFGETETIG